MKNSFILVFAIAFLFSSCTLTNVRQDNQILSENEGWIVFRVINPTAGKELPFTRENERLSIPPLELNSDITFAKVFGGFGFGTFTIQNTEAPIQLVAVKKKEGKYILFKVGKNSRYVNSKQIKPFVVEKGKVNYLGDIYIDLVQGSLPLGVKAKDWYHLRIEDHFDELMDFFQRHGYFSEDGKFDTLAEKNICSETTNQLLPDYCPVRIK